MFRVFKSPLPIFLALVVNQGTLPLAVVISLCRSDVDHLATQYQLGRELFVFHRAPFPEPQRTQGLPAEDISTGRPTQVVVPHVFPSAHGTLEVVGGLHVFFLAFREEHQVGLVVTHDVQAVLVGGLQQKVIPVHELDIAARGHSQSQVAGGR